MPDRGVAAVQLGALARHARSRRRQPDQLAARRGGIKTVIIPKENERDLKEVPDNIKEHLNIRAVKWIDEVLAIALESMPKPLSDEDFRAGSVGTGAELEPDEKNRINTH